MQVAELIRCAAVTCGPRDVPVRARQRWVRGCLHPPLSGVTMLCRWQQFGKCRLFRSRRDLEVTMQHVAMCISRGDLGSKTWRQAGRGRPGGCGASSAMEPIGRDDSCSCPLCSSPRLSPLARVAGIDASQASAGSNGRLIAQLAAAHPRWWHRAAGSEACRSLALRRDIARQMDQASASTRSKPFFDNGAVYTVLAGLPAQHLGRRSSASDCTDVASHRAARSKASSVIAPVSTVGRIAGGAPGP